MPHLDGKFLIASPYLPDSNFLRTVVYIVRHDSEGAFGLVLTRPSELNLHEVLESTMGSKTSRRDLIYFGGPVEGPLCALHEVADLADLDCNDGLHLTSEQESILVLANRPEIRIRFFAGYSGWGPGQLEDELKQGGWLVCDATADDVFSDFEPLWEALVKRVGRSVIDEAIPFARNVDSQLN
ncbi:MAG: YqgE/AlgH family protein [Pirellulaceae bacterium]